MYFRQDLASSQLLGLDPLVSSLWEHVSLVVSLIVPRFLSLPQPVLVPPLRSVLSLHLLTTDWIESVIIRPLHHYLLPLQQFCQLVLHDLMGTNDITRSGTQYCDQLATQLDHK